MDRWQPHFKQVGQFLAVGVAQLALDSTVFVAATALGLPVGPGNVLGRVCGACLGFVLNGRFTFADGTTARLSRRHLRRFVFAWLLMTAISTLLVQMVSLRLSLHAAWLAKPLVEGLMAAVGFVVWRQWVYR